ncbi:hypothetical protein CDD81_687 [Ophiocordyceps australis]|uniref:Uncharacterized protein n=1 Tax=Ophiocordyceps australis TaxID=1399860 RepID=A0A2C5Y0K8_9HYPO|nr:hypothetical protein CDD81_687 [Ophiocordyceps australis]
MDLPILPPPEASLPDLSAKNATKPSRKRTRSAHIAKASEAAPLGSSDAAIFSSDDDPGLDNYVSGHRHKKQYVGSWFHQEPASSDSTFGDDRAVSPCSGRRVLTRQIDSGVFCGSDEIDDAFPMDLVTQKQSRLPQLQKQLPVAQISDAELEARRKIQSCIERGEETINLWSLGLEELSNDTIAPLTNLTRIPLVARDVAFEQQDPELKLHLAMNSLRLVPGAIFDLNNLTFLTLRSNKLTHLPPSIAKLGNLKLLNIAQNRLSSLPMELLELFAPGSKLEKLFIFPNPFLQPDQPFVLGHADSKEPNFRSQLCFVTHYLGRSPLQICDSRGTTLSKFRLPTTQNTSQTIPIFRPGDETGTWDGLGIHMSQPSAVPSLVELTLRTCCSSAELPNMEHYIPDDLPHLKDIIKQASSQRKTGGQWCSRCKRLLIMPPIEWIEWRELSIKPDEWYNASHVVRPISRVEHERAVPFLHRACSFRCGPAE